MLDTITYLIYGGNLVMPKESSFRSCHIFYLLLPVVVKKKGHTVPAWQNSVTEGRQLA